MNATTRSLFAVVGFAGLLLSATGAGHATAITVGTNYQETSVRESVAPPTAAQCQSYPCHWLFNMVASGKQLLVTHLSCRFSLSESLVPHMRYTSLISFNGDQATDREHFFTPRQISLDGAGHYVVEGSPFQLFKAGERPVFSIGGPFLIPGPNTGIDGKCTISGKIGNPPE